MKKLITLTAILFMTFTLQAQNKQREDPHLLKHYYELKDALVAADGLTAYYRIKDIFSAGEGKITEATAMKLVASGKDLEKQREAFAKLSLEVSAILKKEKLTEGPVYVAYCPMKKMYWLSKEPVIKNPYYGKTMLSCGNVTEIIKP